MTGIQIPSINKLANTRMNNGVLFLGDHNVLSSNVDSCTTGIPKGALIKALTVP